MTDVQYNSLQQSITDQVTWNQKQTSLIDQQIAQQQAQYGQLLSYQQWSNQYLRGRLGQQMSLFDAISTEQRAYRDMQKRRQETVVRQTMDQQARLFQNNQRQNNVLNARSAYAQAQQRSRATIFTRAER